MEKFLNQNKEKQDTIINAALSSFGKSGYGKTSMADIARQAGVSKALLFHYFDTKRNLYLFLYDYGMQMLLERIKGKFDSAQKDFFVRIRQAQNIKMTLMTEYPHIFSFFSSAFLEEDDEVREAVEGRNQATYGESFPLLLEDVDRFKFKEDIEPEKVCHMVVWIGEGYVRRFINEKSIGEMVTEMEEYLTILKRAVYQPEYL